MNRALIVIDFINDIISENGKLSWKWYAKFALDNWVIENTNKKISEFRKKSDLIIFVRIAFKEDYSNQPKNSKLFWKANEFWIFRKWSQWDDFYSKLDVSENDIILEKPRVSAFYNTSLDLILKQNNISDLYFSWVALDLAIESSVRDAHDRDYNCFILKNCCAASDLETFNNSIKNLEKISDIKE